MRFWEVRGVHSMHGIHARTHARTFTIAHARTRSKAENKDRGVVRTRLKQTAEPGKQASRRERLIRGDSRYLGSPGFYHFVIALHNNILLSRSAVPCHVVSCRAV